ncbi:WEE protein kinase [Spizellomyces punctatus DAOM BR117]|uniref:WEE protein kinase n=1 Tax=Spizellomyces punctatus (strain DAOM BR117) TaxID=645134 RepID=A0A0L0H9Y1_SPIPD|nr:WEE protein kinase [Spizellomyces punctatus DAOM BR117]KNC97468.1 WEE protein kinase [Spizellomyces punctatus DAOM BR117]|eukprot:XP_016605508.1 WEE protein kinase [Spizellomyces punctatus DAOM BR117]
MAASVAHSPSSRKDLSSFPSNPAVVGAFAGNFMATDSALQSSPFVAAQRDGLPSTSLKRTGSFATPARPRRCRDLQDPPNKPSSLPRPIRSTFANFSQSLDPASVSEAMETDPITEQPDHQQHSTWSSFTLPSAAIASLAPSHQLQNFAVPSPMPPKTTTDPFAWHQSSTVPDTPSANDHRFGSNYTTHFIHKRTASAQSEPDMSQDRSATAFFTPQTKLVKPNPAAFHSTGLLSKKNRPRPSISKPMPETPLKKGSHYPQYRSAGGSNVFKSSAPATAPPATTAPVPGTPTSGLPPTPTRFPPSSIKAKHYRSPLQESPIKNAKKPHLNGDDFGSPTASRSFWDMGGDLGTKDSPSRMAICTAQSSFARNLDPTHSPSTERSRVRSLSSPATQASSLFAAHFNHEQSFHNNENHTPLKSSMSLENIFSTDDSMSIGRGIFNVAGQKGSDMMDCDDDVHTPTTALPPSPAGLNISRHSVLKAYSHLVTPYPVFLTAEYFQRLRERAGNPPSPNKSEVNGVHPDYLDANFRILARLGRGSFADAYKVQSKADGNIYAVKKTRQSFTGYKDGLAKLEEVEILWAIGYNPHCVSLVNAWVQYGYLYLQTELCEGGSLHAYLEDHCRDSSLDEYRTWRILSDIALGLKHIHELNLVHLDIKPGNIFITANGSLKIGDFGLASRSPVPRGDDREGDRTYIAPEILRDAMFGKPADVFSLGLIILEITANVILPENGPYWHKLRQGDLSEINFGEDVSPALVDLIRSMLDPDPAMRPTVEAILTHPYLAQIMSNHSVDGPLAVPPKA